MEEEKDQEDIVSGLKGALRSLVRPIAVVTAEHDGARYAMAATAFCEVSMDPPSMLVCINRNNATFTAVSAGSDFGLSLLADSQEEVSRRCGGGVAQDAKFDVGEWLIEDGKPPRLADGCAAMVLRPVSIVDQGTHAVVIGEVIDVQYQSSLRPLAFHNGDYLFPLATAALQMVAQSRKLGEASGMTDGYVMMDLMKAFYWFDEGLQSALNARGWDSISRSQSIMFANIAIGIRRPADLARNLGVSRQAVSKMLQEMAEQDLVVIEPDPQDKRAQLVNFSEKSRKLRADALDILGQLEERLGKNIGVKTFASMRAALEKDWGEVQKIEPSRASDQPT